MASDLYHELNDALRRLETARWEDTQFPDVKLHYAEERTYVLKVCAGQPNEHLRIVKASSPERALRQGVPEIGLRDECEMMAEQIGALRAKLYGVAGTLTGGER